jgi:hypothetical protein
MALIMTAQIIDATSQRREWTRINFAAAPSSAP